MQYFLLTGLDKAYSSDFIFIENNLQSSTN